MKIPHLLLFTVLLTAEAIYPTRGRKLKTDTKVVAVELGNKGWHKISVPKKKENWMIENGAEPNCKGKSGDDLTDYQTGDKHFCCEFSEDDRCTVTVPRKMRGFMFGTGDATLHKCGKSGNPNPTTPDELQLEYIEPCPGDEPDTTTTTTPTQNPDITVKEVAVELGNKGWHKISVPKKKENWMIENGAKSSCEGKSGDDLTDYQTGDKHFCCEFSEDDRCTVTVPRKMRGFMFGTGDATFHKCGKSGNPNPTTPDELQLEYIEPCSGDETTTTSTTGPVTTVELCVPFGGPKGWHFMEVQEDKKDWFLDNGALESNSCGTGNMLTDRQKKMVNFCCEFPGGETCNVKAPRVATKFIVLTGNATRRKCGQGGNPEVTTPETETLEFNLV